MKPRTARLIASGALTLGLLLASASPVSAAHHQVRINEVFPGLTADPDAEYVELKLAANGENFVDTTSVRIFNAAGIESTPAPTFTSNPPNGQNQRHILIGTPDAELLFPGHDVDLEYANADRIDPAGGAICFTSLTFGGVDCVSWGTFPPATVLPGAHGTPEPGTISSGSSLQRSMAPNCPTLLETNDDTNDSATDFSYVDPQTPLNNADPAEGTACTFLQVFRAGTGTGSISGNGTPAINCPPTCFSQFEMTQTATITATPAAGSDFTTWTNCPMATGNQCDALMTMSRNITANFSGPTGGGTVPMNPATPATPIAPANPAPTPGKKKKKKKKKKKRR